MTRPADGARGRPGRPRRRWRLLRRSCAAVPLLLVPLGPPVEAQTALRCREANEQAIATFKSTLEQMPARDRERAARLIAELEQVIQDNRAAGIGECVTWAGLNRRVSRH